MLSEQFSQKQGTAIVSLWFLWLYYTIYKLHVATKVYFVIYCLATIIDMGIFSRRQHQGNTTWHSTPVPPVQPPTRQESDSRLKGTTYDLFELLEKAQSSRLDDQRCVLPAYFKTVSAFFCDLLSLPITTCVYKVQIKYTVHFIKRRSLATNRQMSLHSVQKVP